jgi:hypothetical protein
VPTTSSTPPTATPTGGAARETTLSFVVMTLAAAFASLVSF